MHAHAKSAGMRPITFLIVGLSLSIGWGIRGNFGHESGAMIAGCLAAIAACLLSGREDWRRRVAFFALFGALGWGFGGSISYMQVISYTHSGHLPSQFWGYGGLFLIGALWAGMGGAGTALPAVANRERLTAFVVPLIFVLFALGVWDLLIAPPLEALGEIDDPTWNRQESPLYWFDSDWTKAVAALVGVCLFDLWQRRIGRASIFDTALAGVLVICLVLWAVTDNLFVAAAGIIPLIPLVIMHGLALLPALALLAVFAVVGAGIGWIVYGFLNLIGVAPVIGRALTTHWGDFDLFRRAQEVGIGAPEFTERQSALLEQFNGDIDAFREEVFTNWPAFFHDFNFLPHLGWVLGLIGGIALYFALYGRFEMGSRLYLYMALGWLAGFLLLPVLLGVRLTPPRSDDWAGILGLYIATLIYLVRYQLAPVAFASLVSATVGGLAFSSAALLKLIMMRPGNPNVVADPETIEAWRYYQGANWHSFLEQTYGFMNGLGIALALGLVTLYVRPLHVTPRVRRWTEGFAVGFVLLLLVFINWRKAVGTWTEQGAVPERMRMFWFESIELSADMWFSIIFWIVGAGVVILLIRHMRRPLSIVPPSWLGRGVLLFLVFLWIAVIFNFERALTGFHEQRLLTEGVITVNAILASVLLLFVARDREPRAYYPPIPARNVPWVRAAFALLLAFLAAVPLQVATTQLLYGAEYAGHAGRQMRFGPDAEWRVNPLLRSERHN